MKTNQRLRLLFLTAALMAAAGWLCIHWIKTDPVIRSWVAIRVTRWIEGPASAGDDIRHSMPVSARLQTTSDGQDVTGRRQFDELAAGDPRRMELFKSLAGNIELPAEDLLSMANTFSGGARLVALGFLANSHAREDPDLYYRILDGMSAGSVRDHVITCGVNSLEWENLKRLIDMISSEANPHEIEALAADLRHVEAPDASRGIDLLELAAGQEEPELADALAFAAGRQSASEAGSPSLDSFGADIGRSFQHGRLKQMLEVRDPAFAPYLAAATITVATRTELVNEWAGILCMSLDLESAVQQGRVLPGENFDTYCGALARTLARMSPQEAAAAISRLPPGKPRDLMASGLLAHLEETGDAAAAERWKKEMSGPSSR